MTISAPARAGVWVQFFAADGDIQIDPPNGGRVNRYRIDSVHARAGATVAGLEPGMTVTRIEAPGPMPPLGQGFVAVGVVEHLHYTDADHRRQLTEISASERGPVAVLIPITKSAGWWALSQEERQGYFLRKAERPGHVEVGTRYASSIFRRLYQARYVPGSTWDFLTYFEMGESDRNLFRRLLAELRDPTLNPEWGFVDREVEIWMTKEG